MLPQQGGDGQTADHRQSSCPEKDTGASKLVVPTTPERSALTEQPRREYAEMLRARYRLADKRQRRQILNEYGRTSGCHRRTRVSPREAQRPWRRGKRSDPPARSTRRG